MLRFYQEKFILSDNLSQATVFSLNANIRLKKFHAAKLLAFSLCFGVTTINNSILLQKSGKCENV